jgi:pyruvate ferredoxin oxidoreductase gamma subunit
MRVTRVPRFDGAGPESEGKMLQVRIHGRGGQGVVSGAEVLAVAAFLEGRHAQAFPSFGSERMGAPVMAFCRIDDRPIRLREPVMEPDALIVQDSTLLHQVDLFNGLLPDGIVLINSTRPVEQLGLEGLSERLPGVRLFVLPATEIAVRHVGRPVPNVPLLAAFAALTQLIGIESVIAAIRDKFPQRLADMNVSAAREAYALAAGEAAHA